MTLSSEGRRVMDDARAALGPSAADRARIRKSLALRVAAGAATTASVSLWSSIVAAATPKVIAVTAGGLALALMASVGYVRWTDVASQRAALRLAPAAMSAAPRSTPGAPGPEPAAELDPISESSRPASTRTASDAPQTSSSRSGRAAATASTPGGPDVAGEIALLGEAQRALAAGQPARALRFLEDHARAFPQGALSQERALARVIALCKLGRIESARREALPFLRKVPDSPLTDRIRAACGNAVASEADKP